MLMKPVEYQLHGVGDLPEDRALQVIGQLFPAWPIWALDDEENLMLTDKELEVMQDTKYGHDLRQLTRSDVVPCFLHGYSTVLRECPCGSRKAFSPHRLLRDGVRGFYIVSMVTGKQSWLPPREAALLCGVIRMM
jgi:hypothetical protein